MCAKKCFVTGVSVVFGKKVSHSNKHINRKFKPNLSRKNLEFLSPKNSKKTSSCKDLKKLILSAKGLRTICKRGHI